MTSLMFCVENLFTGFGYSPKSRNISPHFLLLCSIIMTLQQLRGIITIQHDQTSNGYTKYCQQYPEVYLLASHIFLNFQDIFIYSLFVPCYLIPNFANVFRCSYCTFGQRMSEPILKTLYGWWVR